jgi:hypothetical protein
MKNETRKKWKTLIEQWKKSGLTAREFARATGLNHHTLERWKWRLGIEEKEDDSERKDRFELAQNIGGFIELVRPSCSHVKSNSLKQIPPNDTGEPLELVLGNGLRIRIPIQFNAESLKLVIETLENQ